MGKTDDVLKALCPDSVLWKTGKRFDSNASKDELASWVAHLKL